MNRKKFFGYALTRVWFIVSMVLVVLFAAVNIAFANTTVSELLITLLGSGKQIADGDVGNLQYYKAEAKTKEEAKKNGNDFNIKVAEEGIVMLKNRNNAFPIAKGSRVSVFGKNSVNIVYGGSGSGAVNTEDAKTLYDSLENAGFKTNPTLKAFYEGKESGTGRPNNPSDLDSGASVTLTTGETPYSAYTAAVKSSYASYNDLALVVFSRIGGEGFDLPRVSQETGRHYLELDTNEEEMLKEVVNAGFRKVAIVINSGNAMELGFTKSGEFADKIDGVFLMPGTGETGVMALGKILTGEVNPSGHTADTYATDFTLAPSYQNFGDNSQENGDMVYVGDKKQFYYFVDYEEGIYVGYRYYETRGASDEDWYNQNVVYPFGYGLSYTTFSYEFEDNSYSSLTKDAFTVKVKVTNTGEKAGKGVAELYAHVPYTKGGIEKSEVQLIGFGKTKDLEPGKSETLEIEVNPYYLASYDYKDKNNNGFKGYELEKGDYVFSLRSDAHTAVDSFTLNLDEDIRFDKDPVTGQEVKNVFTDNADPMMDSDYHLQSVLSRNDWSGTFPKTPEAEDHQFSEALMALLKDRKPNNPNTYSEVPTQGDASTSLKLYDLFEKDKDGNMKLDEEGHPYISWDNENWETLLNQISFEDMVQVLNHANFKTDAIASVDKPATLETDGPVGFVNFMSKTTFFGCCAYSSEVMFAQTWNTEILEEFGKHVGDEGILGTGTTPYSGWYAPGMNIHRSPFGGRNFEYFSEDPFLTGKLAAAQIRGARSKGVYCMMKHFALNEQETHRQSNGDISWANEQSIREIYLRPFEIGVKEGKALALMTSFNRIGVRWTGGDYRLLTEILKKEWGFHGGIIDDFNTPSYMPVKQMTYAGGNLNLSASRFWTNADKTNAGDVTVLRNAMKDVLYMVGNSAAMNGHGSGISYRSGIAPYQIIWIVVDILIPLVILAWGIPAIIIVSKRDDTSPKEKKAKK